MPKRGMLEFPARISNEALELLASVDDHAFVMLVYLYVGTNWRGGPNIFFITTEPPDDRCNISILFKLI